MISDSRTLGDGEAKEIRFVTDRTEQGKKATRAIAVNAQWDLRNLDSWLHLRQGMLSMKTTWKKMIYLHRKALKWTGLKRSLDNDLHFLTRLTMFCL